jgi:hypothetical protein
MALHAKVVCLGLGLGLISLGAFSQAVGHVTGHEKTESLSSATLVTPPESDGSRSYNCHVQRLPTSWAFEGSPLGVESHEIYVSEMGGISALFSFRNLGAARIKAVALVVEYLDKQAQAIDEVSIEGGAEGAREGLRPPFAVEQAWVHVNGAQQAEKWVDTLSPGGSVWLGGVKDGTSIPHCPATARVTFEKVQFADGRSQTFSSAGWHIGPIPRRIPPIPTTFRPLPNLVRPFSLMTKVEISSSGEVTDVVPYESDGRSALVSWIRDLMKQEWRFHPALLAGTPVNSQLQVLFQFPADVRQTSIEAERTLGPIVLIRFLRKHDIFPNDYTGNDLVVMYGQANEGTVVE